ncbi:CaiB/BaiF CoA transferase family protein [Acuticoccus yangtzensis]|uniref:CaiB/BaiF CoA transferase family protein n=1 Tax=Acuticoccus yangtzensis TaxID=1443441 RepID=UPI00094984E2|nr:CoA transferase [Acuticoccus yangtzensis]
MRPLEGIRIADFTVHAAGPFSTHMLAMMGAECIKIETALRPDIFRKPHTVYGRAGAATFDQVSAGKLSVRLNLKTAEGILLAKRLVAVSDVAAESFRAGVMERLGLGYDALKAVKNDIVMVSISSSGQTGPDSHFAGYAPLFGAWGGLGFMSGYPDGPPLEMRHVMDHSVGMNAAAATVAALHQRRRTGRGAHVDVAAREVASSLIGEAMMAAAAGVEPARLGNDDHRRAPHGVYATVEADRWLTVSVGSQAEWHGLLSVIGRTDLLRAPQYETGADRHANREALGRLVAAWAATQEAGAAAEALQRAGVPAHVSVTASEIAADPHMRARGAIVDVTETGGTVRAAVGRPARFSSADAPAFARGTPGLGEHEDYVYGELLGLGRAAIDDLVARQIIH